MPPPSGLVLHGLRQWLAGASTSSRAVAMRSATLGNVPGEHGGHLIPLFLHGDGALLREDSAQGGGHLFCLALGTVCRRLRA